MFYYYGRKKRIAGFYPEPKHPIIIEPFAGSAAYSLHGDRWKNDVMLYDINPHVIDVWKFLLSATKKDIESLPEKITGDLPIGAKKLIGFHLNPGSSQPKLTSTKFNRWPTGKRYIAANIHKIKHWQFFSDEFSAAENLLSTWFIDPPYQGSAGRWYFNSKIDYEKLSIWVKSRRGQVIACDNPSANWLPFIKLINSDYASIGKRKLNEGVFLTDEI